MLLVPAISTCHSFGSIVLGMGENPLEKAGAFLRMPSKLRMASKITKHFDKLTDSLSLLCVSAKVVMVYFLSAFLYIRQMSAWWMGKITKRCGFSCRSGSGARSPSFLAILCYNCFSDGLGVILAFFVAWAILVQNSSQLFPLLRMKLVISRKA